MFNRVLQEVIQYHKFKHKAEHYRTVKPHEMSCCILWEHLLPNIDASTLVLQAQHFERSLILNFHNWFAFPSLANDLLFVYNNSNRDVSRIPVTSKMENFSKIVFSRYLLPQTFFQIVLPSFRLNSLLNPLSWFKKFGKTIFRLVVCFFFSHINPFQSIVTFLYPLKTSENQGVQKCDAGLKWVNQN